MNKKRIFYYDALRAIAIIGIVFCHASVNFVTKGSSGFDFTVSAFYDCFREFSIPVFVMLSGALLIGKKDSIKSFFKKRLSRLFIPFIFWAIVYILYQTYLSHSFSLSNSIDIFFGTSHTLGVTFWFVWMITIAYIGIFIINKILSMKFIKGRKDEFILLLAILSLIYISICHFGLFNPYEDKIIYFTSFLSYIIIGYFIANTRFLEEKISRNKLIITSFILFAASYLWYIFCYVLPMSQSHKVFSNLSYFNLLILFMSVNLFLFFKYMSKTDAFSKIEKNTLGKVINTISGYSYGIYLVHYLIIYSINLNLIRIIDFRQGPPLIWIPVLVIITIVISLLIFKVLEKIPYLEKVTGKG